MGVDPASAAARMLLDEEPAARNRRLYAVLDGARDPAVHPLATTSGLPAMCLYRGPIDPLLARNAPWLVRLDRASAASRELVVRSWGRSFGIFCEAIGELDLVGRHLRGFLRVRAPDGRKLLFRFYDPRVWRPFLPTLTAEEARRFAGPAVRFLTESEGGDALVEDVPSAAGMARRVLPLDGATRPTDLERGEPARSRR